MRLSISSRMDQPVENWWGKKTSLPPAEEAKVLANREMR